MSNFGGIKDFKWVATGGDLAADGVSLGRLKSDSSHEPDTKTETDSKGLEIFAGEDDVLIVRSYDLSKYAALRTKSISDDNIVDCRITDLEGANDDRIGFSVIVNKPTQFESGKRNYFEARFKRFVIA